MAVTINNAKIFNLHIGPIISLGNLISSWDVASVISYPRTGVTWYDLVGNNNGSMKNMSSDNFNIEADGNFIFDGSDEYVSIADDPSLDTGLNSFTVSAWIKPETGLSSYAIVANKRGIGDNIKGWRLSIKNVEDEWKIFDSGIDDASSEKFIDGSKHYSFDWHHIVMSYASDSKVTIYVNSVVDCSIRLFSDYGGISNDIPLEIGGTAFVGGGPSVPYRLFKGSIAQVQFYNKELSASEIKQQYMSSKARFGL